MYLLLGRKHHGWVLHVSSRNTGYVIHWWVKIGAKIRRLKEKGREGMVKEYGLNADERGMEACWLHETTEER